MERLTRSCKTSKAVRGFSVRTSKTMLIACLAMAALWLACLPAHAQLQPLPIQRWDGNGHYYQAMWGPDAITWSAAAAAAVARGGYLATVTSAAENAFVAKLVDDDRMWHLYNGGTAHLGPWLGGFQAQEAQSRLVDGSGSRVSRGYTPTGLAENQTTVALWVRTA